MRALGAGPLGIMQWRVMRNEPSLSLDVHRCCLRHSLLGSNPAMVTHLGTGDDELSCTQIGLRSNEREPWGCAHKTGVESAGGSKC